MQQKDTVFALCTPRGKSGVAVVRISGPAVLDALKCLGVDENVPPRVAICRVLYDQQKRPIDQAIILYFPRPNSFTGDDVVELHVHGSQAVVKLLFEELQTNCRIANPGEFSLRAFLNGKLDLTKAEGIADLIAAETEAQVRQAFAQSSGRLEKLYSNWRNILIDLLASLEACIDFPEDVSSAGIVEVAHKKAQELGFLLTQHLDDDNKGERLRNGIRVAILGAPNVGKSTLFNYLARRDMAIVSEYPGTTRDVLEVHLDLGGYPFVIVDTAGVRESSDFVELEGIRRARLEGENADIKIIMHPYDSMDNIASEVSEDECDEKTIYVLSKADGIAEEALPVIQGKNFYPISVHTDVGMGRLLSIMQEKSQKRLPKAGDIFITSQRHRSHLQNAAKIIADIEDGMPIEIFTEYLRLAAKEIGKVTGEIYGDDILDDIFGKFCIGK